MAQTNPSATKRKTKKGRNEKSANNHATIERHTQRGKKREKKMSMSKHQEKNRKK